MIIRGRVLVNVARIDGERGTVSNNTINVHESNNISEIFTFGILGNPSDMEREWN